MIVRSLSVGNIDADRFLDGVDKVVMTRPERVTLASVADGKALYRRGINCSGGEFAADAAHLPGTISTDYGYDSAASFLALAARGHTLIRLPIRWERIQPTRAAALDSAEVGRLNTVITNIAAAGMQCILDVHNYARYINSTANGGATLVLNDTLPISNLVDLWTRMSTAFTGNAGIYAYGLMNEPHDIVANSGLTASQTWESISQQLVTAIRNNSDTTKLMVPGYNWSGAQTWTATHPVPWIIDPASNVSYEAHYYFDVDNSGDYPDDYATENAAAVTHGYASLIARVTAELTVFTNWVAKNGVRGFLGECGWPNNADTASWNAVGDAIYAILDSRDIDATYWATGARWGSGYKLSAYTGSPLTTVKSQATVLETAAHLTKFTATQTQIAGLNTRVTTLETAPPPVADGSVNIQSFTSNGTWTKPAGATTVKIICVGGGGGGGSGARRASGTASSGGAGGGGGGYTITEMPASLLGSTEAVTVGIGGPGSAARTANDSNGTAGTAGGDTFVGVLARATGGTGGAGGTTSGASSSGTNGAGTRDGASGGGGNLGAAGTSGNRGVQGGGGGAGGGGVSTTPAFFAGGTGGVSIQLGTVTGATAGTTDGASGAAGASVAAGVPAGGGSGAGGASSILTAGGTGGNGGSYGGAGAGGGSSLNGSNSGAGGSGFSGIVIMITR